jgi:hypothetical protein
MVIRVDPRGHSRQKLKNFSTEQRNGGSCELCARITFYSPLQAALAVGLLALRDRQNIDFSGSGVVGCPLARQGLSRPEMFRTENSAILS